MVLVEARRGVFDSDALQAFVNQLTLFPIGSEVELNNGERATVIRRDAGHYAFPIVRSKGSNPRHIALREADVSISRPTIPEGALQQRIDRANQSSISIADFER